MKTLSKVLRENADRKELINAVMDNLDIEQIEDINRHGIDGGFGNFIYYADTVKFYEQNKKEIISMAKDMASDMGENLLEMIGGFNCLKYYDYKKKRWIDEEGQEAIGKTIYGNEVDKVVANALAWFAAEEVCRMFEN
jgi:RNA-binding protein YhbY